MLNPSADSLLEVRNLSVSYKIRGCSYDALRNVSFKVAAGEGIGLIGESGSGKTSLALSVVGLLPKNGRAEATYVSFRGTNLLRMQESALERIRGRQIGFLFQEAAAALNPVMHVGDQIAEVVRAHHGGTRKQHRQATEEVLRQVRLPDSEEFYRSYPHQISGGQRQRVVIAQALAGSPFLLIVDEPTTALDTITQAGILSLFGELKQRMGFAIVMISHAAVTLSGLVDRVLVMHKGEIVDQGTLSDVCLRAVHPQSKMLIGSPSTDTLQFPATARQSRATSQKEPRSAFLILRGVNRKYTTPQIIDAVKDVHLTISCKSILALIGRSGSGKSTLARCIAGLEFPDSGEVLCEGYDLLRLSAQELGEYRRLVQLVFQDSIMALNPSFSVEDIIAEPLRIAGVGRSQRRRTAEKLMDRVELPPEWLRRKPFQMSGGQRQRVALARALAVGAKLIVLDESFAGLDIPVQEQLLRLMKTLRDESHVAWLLISHDISLAAKIADTVAIMKQGEIVEVGEAEEILLRPRHPNTQALIAAIPHWKCGHNSLIGGAI